MLIILVSHYFLLFMKTRENMSFRLPYMQSPLAYQHSLLMLRCGVTHCWLILLFTVTGLGHRIFLEYDIQW